MTRSRTRRNRGISTAEVLVGTALSLAAVLAMYSVFRLQTRAFAAHNMHAESQVVTRTTIDLLTRELRMAAYDPTTPGAIPTTVGDCPGVKAALVAASDESITFRRDLDGDGLLLSSGDVITYDVLTGELRRTDGVGLPVTLVDDVPSGGFRLRYYDGSNPPNQIAAGGGVLTQNELNCVQKVRVTIRAEVDNPLDATPKWSMAESEIAIRNLSLTNF